MDQENNYVGGIWWRNNMIRELVYEFDCVQTFLGYLNEIYNGGQSRGSSLTLLMVVFDLSNFNLDDL
eukprot:gnl/Chilomastix_caulleri/3683.p1 GENE.gnl/Chilomastix_caulleri/3683~~gnl/Chilomastix_caulleri/3683.p1  ORF type:complete len:67 (-),score=5.30 gnl/Chilomastix_caulleri/3683:128-328(-)